MARNRVELKSGDALVYRGMQIDQGVLDAILNTDTRLLWSFVRNSAGDVQAVAYSESECIWMTDADVLQPDEVEL